MTNTATAGYRRFILEEVLRAHARLNRAFFDGTTVDADVPSFVVSQ